MSDEKKKKFKRQNSHKMKRVPESWRKPRGIHSPMRQKRKHAPKMPNVGFRSPEETRGLHPSGLEDVLVHNTDDLEELDAEEHAVRIATGVGGRKREQIADRAEERGLTVLNYQEQAEDEAEDAEAAEETDTATDDSDVQNNDGEEE